MEDGDKEKILIALRFLNMFVVSLDRIGSYSAINGVDYAVLLRDFIDDFDVTRKAVTARSVLCEFFDDEIIEGRDASEMELLMQGIEHWTSERVQKR